MFAKTWRFDDKTSSPLYPQSNGKAENAVKTVKRLFSKCKEAGRSEFQALLDWRNTPSAGMGTSPAAERLMGRRCKTLLPVAGSLLQPQYAVLIGVKKRSRNLQTKPETATCQYGRTESRCGTGEPITRGKPTAWRVRWTTARRTA